MGKNNVEMSNAQVVAAMGGGFFVVGLIFVAVAFAQGQMEVLKFAGLLLGMGALGGMIGMGMHAFRR
jgi:hypothetical protein